MNKFFLAVYDHLSKNRPLSIALLLVVTALCVFSALRLDYKENIADFLPTDPEKERYTSVYDDLSNQGQITVIFAIDTTACPVGVDAIDTQNAIIDAMDAFEENWRKTDTALLVNDLRCKVDGSQVFDAIDFIRENPPLFLTEADYRRMDSLLAEPDYVASCMTNLKRMMAMPTAGFVVDGVKTDPLNLYSPALQRLNTLNPTQGYRVEDEYLFNERGDMGFAFFSSPFSGSDTQGNAQIVELINKVVEQTEAEHPEVRVTAVGAPTIAVTNAQQIKKDSFLSISLAIVLIFGILMFTMARKRNLIWLGISVLFGWIFALAVIALFKSSISIIVVGIGSVIVGIAVNYPLHFLDHIKQEPDKREALKDVIQPLVIGNLTTVAAFACLVFVKAEAMRDLGLFGALMLVGTILFVMVFLPLFAVVPRKTNKLFVDDGTAPSETWRKVKLYAFWPLVIITLILSWISKETAFDADLHNINYMTQQQQKDLAVLNESLQKEGETDLIYVVSEAIDFQEAIRQNETMMAEFRSIMPDSVNYSVSGLDGLLPSLQKQEQSLELWQDFWQRHPNIVEQVKAESSKVGFTENAFAPFTDGITKTYKPLNESEIRPVLALCKTYVLQHDSLARVVNFVRVPVSASEHLKQQLREVLSSTDEPSIGSRTLNSSGFAFSISDVGNNLVTALSDDFDYILYVCSIVVFLFLCLSFGRLELSIMAFLPLTVGWAWILGIMHLGDIKFNIVNIILATFIFGQGDDYTIFITEGLLYEYAYGKKMLKNYRNSVILSGILMFAGIGTLIFAKHPAMRSLAEVAIIGMATVVLMACYLPPLVFGWLTKKKGRLREVPLTLKRMTYTFLTLLVFFIFAFVIVTPLTLLYILLVPPSEKKRYRYHQMIAFFMRLALKALPGVKFSLENKFGETFDKPAVIIANHQSHLDLLCTMMLHPKVVLLTTDWVWKNPIYGIIIRFAEYYPVSDGYDKNVERLKKLVERGYSVVVYPEGTRSETGEILRFHKGAFSLAQALNVDILPVFVHGANHVMPKKDFVLREGQISVEIGQRMPAEEVKSFETRALTSRFHKYYIAHFEEVRRQRENTAYVLPFVRYKYVYKGNETERECRRNLKKIRAHAAEIDILNYGSILLKNSGIGELAWTLALVHRDMQVYAIEADTDKHLIAAHTSYIPENLHFVREGETVPQCDYSIDCQVFLK
ncbi:MAG: 1-acyl-sn-glycerol-3-phosphate acyltransferase [Bacteroidales bacterium]|nr:1-acyl-sn-glycerol-3-phosphate acyltransferase [Bacteroidales bacterium]